jgi:Flp pilus assembly pilin Flp
VLTPPARDYAPAPPDDELKYTIVGAAACADPSRRSASMQKLYTWLAREDGQTMAEYGVVLAVITIAVFGALALLSGNIVGAMTRVAGYIT